MQHSADCCTFQSTSTTLQPKCTLRWFGGREYYIMQCRLWVPETHKLTATCSARKLANLADSIARLPRLEQSYECDIAEAIAPS